MSYQKNYTALAVGRSQDSDAGYSRSCDWRGRSRRGETPQLWRLSRANVVALFVLAVWITFLLGARSADAGKPTHTTAELKNFTARTVVVEKQPYGTMPDGTVISLYTLSNGRHMRMTVMDYGATVTGVFVPDAMGQVANVMLHLDSLDAYLKGHPLFGSLVGRYANRIAGAAFEIDGVRHALTRNAGADHIHGGRVGFQKIVWRSRPLHEPNRVGVELTHTSPDGNEGYPGQLAVRVVYALTDSNQLIMEYSATTNKPTHVNLTNHAYWNLAGASSGDVLDHVVMINADKYVVSDKRRFPTGPIRTVRGTPLDFTSARRIGARIDQLESDNYDDCYVLNRQPGESLALAARVTDAASGRAMEVWTTQPGVQFYTAKGLSDKYGSDGHTYGPYYGFCLETQHYPDSPNQPHFPSTLLRPGETYHQVTVYRFLTR